MPINKATKPLSTKKTTKLYQMKQIMVSDA